MNLYDRKVVKCSQCGRHIGEIDMKAKVIFPRCDNCSKNTPQKKTLPIKLTRDYDFPKKEVINTLPS